MKRLGTKKAVVWLIILAFTSATFFWEIPAASAQGVSALGEIRASGRTLIDSSNGGWTISGPSYPLIRHTAIKTEDGVTAVYFRDGSRVSLSKDSSAVVDGIGSAYAIKLVKGEMAFNINPSSSLLVVTPSANISVNMNDNRIIQKAAYKSGDGASGLILAGEKGTEVRTISGRVIVNADTENARIVMAGESMFVGLDNSYKAYKTQALENDAGNNGQETNGNKKKKKKKAAGLWLEQGAVVTGFVGTAVILSVTNKGYASPTCPQAPCQ